MNDKLANWAKDQGVESEQTEEENDASKNQDENLDNTNLPDAANDENFDEDETPKLSDAEQRAMQMGWQPKDKWDGDPDDWTSAKRFIQTGEVIQANKVLHSKVDRMQNEFENRIQNLQTLHENKIKLEMEALKAKRDQAANDADIDTYNAVNKEIDNIEQTVQKPEISAPQNAQPDLMQKIVETPVVQQFVDENPWIREQGAKGVFGQKIFTDWIQSNMNNPNAVLEDGLKAVQEAVTKEFPQHNPNRKISQSMGTRSNGPKKSAQNHRLTMKDLSHQEKLIWNSMGGGWKDEKDFLQAVADDRKLEV